jgi:transcription elongation factor S-II
MEDIESMFTEKIIETIPEKEAKYLTKRCIKAVRYNISSNNIQDPDDNILSLKLDFLYKKLTPEIIEQLNNNELRVKNLLSMDIYDIDKDLKSYKEFLSSKVVQDNTTKCSIYTCPRCKAKEHTYREIQTRSIDEPKSVKCTCLICGFKFGV